MFQNKQCSCAQEQDYEKLQSRKTPGITVELYVQNT